MHSQLPADGMERCIFAHAISNIDRPLIRDVLCLYLFIRQIVCDLNPRASLSVSSASITVYRLLALPLFRLLGTDLADVIGFSGWSTSAG